MSVTWTSIYHIHLSSYPCRKMLTSISKVHNRVSFSLIENNSWSKVFRFSFHCCCALLCTTNLLLVDQARVGLGCWLQLRAIFRKPEVDSRYIIYGYSQQIYITPGEIGVSIQFIFIYSEPWTQSNDDRTWLNDTSPIRPMSDEHHSIYHDATNNT